MARRAPSAPTITIQCSGDSRGDSSGRDARAVRRLARRHPALGPHLGGVRIPEVGGVQVHRAPFQRRPAVDPRPPTCHPPQSQIVLVHVAFPQHCLTIYNPLQRDNLPRQAGAPRAGLSTSVPANVHANGQTALCFAALLAVFLAFPQSCLTFYPLQRDTYLRQAGAPRAGLSTSHCACQRYYKYGVHSGAACLPGSGMRNASLYQCATH